ncbi:MAG: hypothetical protein ACSLE0_19020 [Chitinophagaceae bacterium]
MGSNDVCGSCSCSGSYIATIHYAVFGKQGQELIPAMKIKNYGLQIAEAF